MGLSWLEVFKPEGIDIGVVVEKNYLTFHFCSIILYVFSLPALNCFLSLTSLFPVSRSVSQSSIFAVRPAETGHLSVQHPW